MKIKKGKRINIPDLVTCIAFFAILIFMSVMTIILPKQDFLEMENSYAEKLPELSAKSVYNRTYMNKFPTILPAG